MRRTLILSLCCAIILSCATTLAADDPDVETLSPAIVQPLPDTEPARPSFLHSIGVRSWFSSGSAQESIAGNVGPPFCDTTHFVDVLSELTWRDTTSLVTEINAEFFLRDGLLIHVDVGFGGVDEGEFRDIDYCTSGRQDRFSDTLHPVPDGSVFYVQADILHRIFHRQRFTAEAFLGHHFWYESFVSRDGVDLFPGTRTEVMQGNKIITQEYRWSGIRLGGQVRVELIPRLILKSRLAVIPVGNFRMEDVHHLRDDLKQDPSIIDSASIKLGVAADATLACRIWGGLLVEVGYQYFQMESNSGEGLTRTFDGDAVGIFNGAEASRHGFLVSLLYEF